MFQSIPAPSKYAEILLAGKGCWEGLVGNGSGGRKRRAKNGSKMEDL